MDESSVAVYSRGVHWRDNFAVSVLTVLATRLSDRSFFHGGLILVAA